MTHQNKDDYIFYQERVIDVCFTIRCIELTIAHLPLLKREAIISLILEFFRADEVTRETFAGNIKKTVTAMQEAREKGKRPEDPIEERIASLNLELIYQDLNSCENFKCKTEHESVIKYTAFIMLSFLAASDIPTHPLLRSVFVLYLPYYLCLKQIITLSGLYSLIIHFIKDHHIKNLQEEITVWSLNFDYVNYIIDSEASLKMKGIITNENNFEEFENYDEEEEIEDFEDED